MILLQITLLFGEITVDGRLPSSTQEPVKREYSCQVLAHGGNCWVHYEEYARSGPALYEIYDLVLYK